MENYTLVAKGFDALTDSMSKYITAELIKAYGQDWWSRGVWDRLYDDQRRHIPQTGTPTELANSMDTALCLLIIDINWHDVFVKVMPRDCKNWVMELKGTRNKVAHRGSEDLSDSDTWRALDTMSRLCEQVDPDGTQAINSLLRQARYGSARGSVASDANTAADHTAERGKRKAEETVAVHGLPSWRDVMEPHQDVAEGRYRNAEFAADLAQVARGEGSLEYRDPVEFFGRTYVTEGMKGLLVQSLRRVSGLGGEPVIQLKTAFGGGKTHSMLALYHLMRSRNIVGEIPNARPVLDEAGISEIPEVHVAVIVGTALSVTNARRPSNMPGITVNTLWGEIAYQLALSKGDPGIYDYVKESDKRGVAPGSEALTHMFDACGRCLVLVDELVAYAKKLWGAERLVAGDFDNFITFIQELTEAARASKYSIVVASIPESDREIGGESGQRALEAIEHTFGRMEAIWKPVTANEGFEVVRRRLFLDCKDEHARDEVCNAFSKMYNENQADFPVEARELEYRDRMVSCYPIHPEVFDRLYEDWSTLETFQRTRGVLRLMAAVIHELWMSQDPSPMIMPGSLPLDVPNVRDELTRYLDENWNAVVSSEIDGKGSLPYRNDAGNTRYGNLLASRRVSRAIMLGSAPDVRGQRARGIERSYIRLGVVQPGENIAVFNDALGTLQGSASFLYADGQSNRFWFDTRPTLRKVMEDRKSLLSSDEANHEIEGRLAKLHRKAGPIVGVHICPKGSSDVPDDQTLRAVVLPPTAPHLSGREDSRAIKLAQEILDTRGGSPRRYRNMLVFIAADSATAGSLESAAKTYLAWVSIDDTKEELNLDMAQQREVAQNIQRADTTLKTRLQETYCWVIAPRIDVGSGSMGVEWEVDKIPGNEDAVQKAAKKLLSNESAIETWAPALLTMELDGLLWKDSDHIQIKSLWDYLCSYCYLPRLANYGVLEDAIRKGLGSREYFGIAGGVGEGRYIDLTLGEEKAFINTSDFLVKPKVAQDQLDREELERRRREDELRGQGGGPSTSGANDPGTTNGPGGSGFGGPTSTGPTGGGATGAGEGRREQKPTSFSMTTHVDVTRASKDLRSIVNEIVNRMTEVDGANVTITFDMHADVPDGISPQTVRTISENCNTLHIDDYRFDR